MLNTGRTVPLNDPSRHHELRAYYLLYSHRRSAWYVVVAGSSWNFHAPGTVITLLTRQQYERDRGAICPDALRSAVRQAPGTSASAPATINEGVDDLFHRRGVKIVVFGWDRDFALKRIVLGTPPLPQNRVTKAQAINAASSSSVWPWIKRRAETLQIDEFFQLDRLELGDVPPSGVSRRPGPVEIHSLSVPLRAAESAEYH